MEESINNNKSLNPKLRKLTVKQEQFAQKVVEGKSNSDAYRFAYSTKNMLPSTVNRRAHFLSHQAHIAARINELKAFALQKHGVTVDKVINEFMKIGFFNIKSLYDKDGNLRNINDLTDDAAAAIGGITVAVKPGKPNGEGEAPELVEIRTIKVIDKTKSLEMLGRYLSIFGDKVPDLTPKEQVEKEYNAKKERETDDLIKRLRADNAAKDSRTLN